MTALNHTATAASWGQLAVRPNMSFGIPVVVPGYTRGANLAAPSIHEIVAKDRIAVRYLAEFPGWRQRRLTPVVRLEFLLWRCVEG